MKNKLCYLLVIFLLPLSGYCYNQTNYNDINTGSIKPESEVKVSSVNTDDEHFAVTEIPDKWKDESAVIICQQYYFSYLRKKKGREISEMVRRRIKLLDKAAIDKFSEFYFVSEEEGASVEIKIVKPDGNVIEINTTDALEVTSEVPDFFKYGELKTFSYLKLAIPNLEAGDIIDYSFKDDDAGSYGYMLSLMSSYPIMYQSFDFVLDRGFNLNFKSFNNAPEISLCGIGEDFYGRERNIIKHYRLVDEDREKVKDLRWVNNYKNFPFIKFVIASERLGYAYEFNKEKNYEQRLYTSIEDNQFYQLFRLRNNLRSNQTAGLMISPVAGNARAMRRTGADKIKIVENTYMVFRLVYQAAYYTANNGIDHPVYIDDMAFCTVFARALDMLDIDYQTIVTTDKSVGTIKDVVSTSELYLGLKFTLDKDYYVFPLNSFSNFGDIPAGIQGAEALVFDDIRDKNTSPKHIVLPATLPEENEYKSRLKVKLDSGFEKIAICDTTELSGAIKYDYSNMYVSPLVCLQEDDEKYRKDSYIPLYFKTSVFFQNLPRSYASAYKHNENEWKTNREEYYKSNYEFELESFENFDVVNAGRHIEERTMSLTCDLLVKDMIFQAGNNYMINIGWLIGDQVKIKEDETPREYDFFIEYPRTYSTEIEFSIPDGYTLADVSSLNVAVENESGKFTSSARVTGDKLLIDTRKVYKVTDASKDKWTDFIEFTDAAFNFSQAKIMLIKKQ